MYYKKFLRSAVLLTKVWQRDKLTCIISSNSETKKGLGGPNACHKEMNEHTMTKLCL